MAGRPRQIGAFAWRYRGVIAIVMLIAALLFAGLYRVADGAEKHSYNVGAIPPATVKLTAGRTYEISLRGGRAALEARGFSPKDVRCSWSLGSTDVWQPLTVTPLSEDVRPTHAVATFVAPVSGSVRIDCAEWGAVYVDDADNSGWDYAGLFLVLTAVCLFLFVALGASALYARSARASGSGDGDEVERAVDVLRGHGEVRGSDGGDVID